MKKLSIIIPVYNVEKYLPKCLDSLLDETVKDYEIILVNDGSTDGSLTVAEGYRVRYPELFTVITTENRGQGHARNVGIENAHGEFLYFIDSDDYLTDGGLRGIASCLGRDFDICIFDSIAVNVEGKELKYMKGCDRDHDLNLQDYPGLILQGPDVWNKIFRRSLFLESGVRFPSGVWFEDLCTVQKLYFYTDKVIYIPVAWHRYLQRYDSVTNTRKVLRNLEIIPAVDDVVAFYREHGLGERLRDELEFLAFYCQFLTSSVRVNLCDWRSPVQEELMRNFLEKFPQYEKNPYVQRMSRRHRLLTRLLMNRRRFAVHVLMKANNLLKTKKV